jgi:peptide-methionine (R)-S-oxide reductase
MPDKVIKTEEEWKKILTPEQYRILREGGTEAPFSDEMTEDHTPGMFACAACGQQLFNSDAKFDSGTGWPSFDQAIPGTVEMQTDDSHGMNRVEVRCSRCGSHLGHVFPDGPQATTGQRFCINSACLRKQPSSGGS